MHGRIRGLLSVAAGKMPVGNEGFQKGLQVVILSDYLSNYAIGACKAFQGVVFCFKQFSSLPLKLDLCVFTANEAHTAIRTIILRSQSQSHAGEGIKGFARLIHLVDVAAANDRALN
ncbi:MAG: hypothetical protein Q9200_003701 [Gallowayella weberi]